MLQSTRDGMMEELARSKDPNRIKKLKQLIPEYNESIQRLMGGDPLSWEVLPGEFKFRHMMARKGATGYVEDVEKAYRAYLYGLTKKMFDEPAV